MRLLGYLIPVVMILVLGGCNNHDTPSGSAGNATEYSSWQAIRAEWQGIAAGRSTAADVAALFKTPVGPEERYAYAIDQDKTTGNTFLMMVSLDDDSIVTAKYYWEWITTTALLANADNWEIAIDTQIPAHVLQQHSATVGPREEAILEYLAHGLYEISDHYADLDQVFSATTSMKKIYTLAATQYSTRVEKQTLLSEGGFTFDAGVFGGKCTMRLRPVDERSGWYFLVVKGRKNRNFFTGE